MARAAVVPSAGRVAKTQVRPGLLSEARRASCDASLFPPAPPQMIAFIISTGVVDPEDPVGRGGQVLTPRKAQEASGELPSPPLPVLPQTEQSFWVSPMQRMPTMT